MYPWCRQNRRTDSTSDYLESCPQAPVLACCQLKGKNTMHTLLICRTCPRDTASSGTPGGSLAATLGKTVASWGVQVLRVNCLGSCRQPCAVALDAPSKFRLRFSNLQPGDAGDLEKVVRQYCLSDSGRIATESLPPALRGHLTAVAPKMRSSSAASVFVLPPSLL